MSFKWKSSWVQSALWLCHSQKALENRLIWNVCTPNCPVSYLLQIHWNECKHITESALWFPFRTTTTPPLSKKKQWAPTIGIFLFKLITLTKAVQDICPQIWIHPNTCRFDPTLERFAGVVAVAKASPYLTRPLLKFFHFYGKLLTINGSKACGKDIRLIQSLVKRNICEWVLLWNFRFVWILQHFLLDRLTLPPRKKHCQVSDGYKSYIRHCTYKWASKFYAEIPTAFEGIVLRNW